MRTLLEIECSFFGCIFDAPEERILEAKKEGASPDWFEDPECRLCWRAIESIYSTKSIKDISFITILQEATRFTEIKSDPAYGLSFKANFYDRCIHYRQGSSDDERSDIKSYSDILRKNALRKRISQAITESTERMRTSADPFAEGSRLTNDLNTLMRDSTPVKEIAISDLTDDAMATYEKAHEEFAVKKNYDYIAGIPMPWKYVSKVMNGLQPGLHIIAARPSVGKTSFVLDCANFWASMGYHVAFNCLDMASKQIVRRPMANLARVAIDKAERGIASLEELERLREKKKIIDGWGNSGNFQIKCEYDVGKLKTWSTIAHSAGMLDILIIDYVQQLRCPGYGNRSENDRLTNISAILKSIAIELNMPVIALSQLSRDNVKDKNGARPPTMADLRGSGSLEQDAFSITLLYFDDAVKTHWRDVQIPDDLLVATSTDGDEVLDEARAIRPVWWDFQKNQNGRTGRCPFVVYNNHFRWYEGDRENDDVTPGFPKSIGKFSRITADWRFDEEPIVSLAKRNKVIYPNYWEYQAAKLCQMRGKEIPDEIRAKVNKNFLDNLEQGTFDGMSKPQTTSPVVKQTIPVHSTPRSGGNDYMGSGLPAYTPESDENGSTSHSSGSGTMTQTETEKLPVSQQEAVYDEFHGVPIEEAIGTPQNQSKTNPPKTIYYEQTDEERANEEEEAQEAFDEYDSSSDNGGLPPTTDEDTVGDWEERPF